MLIKFKMFIVINLVLMSFFSCKIKKENGNKELNQNENNNLGLSLNEKKSIADSFAENNEIQMNQLKKEISADKQQFIELLKSGVVIDKLDNKYSIISNVKEEELIKLDKEYEISGIKLSSDKEWWVLVNTDEKKLVRYIDDCCSIGTFYFQDGYLLFDGGTSENRVIYIYGIEDDFKFKVTSFSLGERYILINPKLGKVATQFLGNKNFRLGIDDWETARVGICVTDFNSQKTQKLIPDTDTNFILFDFENQLLYMDNNEIKSFPLNIE